MNIKHPISRIEWLDVNKLHANEYNPNTVLTPEMKLLEFSLCKQGWIQPILVAKDGDGYVIIDGFHRYTLARTSKKVYALSNPVGHVPCAVLDLTLVDRMLLTVRINRAKGNHIALKMHEMVSALYHEHKVSMETLCQELGADKHEMETLMMENIFQKKDVANKDFSKSWYPKGSIAAKGRELKRGA